MILDAENLMSKEQAVTTTAISANVIDVAGSDNAEKNLGAGEGLYLVVKCDEAATADGAATVTFTLESSAAEGLGSSNVHLTSGAIGKAALTAGAEVMKVMLPHGDYKRYLGLRYTVATGPLTAGKFSAFLVKDVDAFNAYKSGYSISTGSD